MEDFEVSIFFFINNWDKPRHTSYPEVNSYLSYWGNSLVNYFI